MRPTPADVAAAHTRIAPFVRRTPLERSAALSDMFGVAVHLKLECWQPTRSFKVRGAFSALAALDPGARARGVVTASAGNHGQAVALAAARFGVRATVFVPADAPRTKKHRIRALGAALDESSASYDDAEDAAVAWAERNEATFVHAFSDDAVVAGQATVALEVLEELPDVRTVLVPVGGGGLIAGIGVVLRDRAPHVRLLGVQSVETRVMHDSLRAGRLVDLAVTPTLADGLAGRIDARSLARVQELVHEIHLVEETDIAEAIRTLFVRDGIVAEGAGAVAIAALTALRQVDGPAAAIITGGNIDAARLSHILGS